jgi:hypothetical protein
LELEAGSEGPITVRSPLFEKPYDVAFANASRPKALETGGQTFIFQARKGGLYTFTRAASVDCGGG